MRNKCQESYLLIKQILSFPPFPPPFFFLFNHLILWYSFHNFVSLSFSSILKRKIYIFNNLQITLYKLIINNSLHSIVYLFIISGNLMLVYTKYFQGVSNKIKINSLLNCCLKMCEENMRRKGIIERVLF